MFRKLLARIFYSKLRGRPSVAKSISAGGFGALFVAAIVTFARTQSGGAVELDPVEVGRLVDHAWNLLTGALALAATWGIRDAQDAAAERQEKPILSDRLQRHRS